MADEIEDAGTSDAFDRQNFNPKFKWVDRNGNFILSPDLKVRSGAGSVQRNIMQGHHANPTTS